MGEKCAHHQTRILILIALVIVLLILPAYTLAQDKDSAYGKHVTITPLQRTLDAYGKGPFCLGCHNTPYPLPPEQVTLLSTRPVYGPVDMEPGLKRLTYNPGRNVGAVYSPKENRILWITDSLGNWTIWEMNDDGSSKRQLTSNNVISGWPSWSPDGQEIAYWSWDPTSNTSDIWKMKTDGSTKTKITTDGSFKGPPMWSPRGDRIAYTANQTGNMEVYIINTDGGGGKQLTTGHNPGYSLETRTTWNPDGVRLYYQVLTFPLPPGTHPIIPDDVAFVEIYVINVDTGERDNLTPKLHENVRSVSSDGKKMACISLRSFNYGLWVMNSDGTNQTRLTWHDKGDRAPRFSPDGKKIVYWSIPYGTMPKIWMINADGSNNTQLTKNPRSDVYPCWSPDGEKIVFESDRTGKFDIWCLSLERPITVDVNFDGCTEKGGIGKAFLTVKPSTNFGKQLRVEKIGLRFDWDRESQYVENMSIPPRTLSGPDNVCQINIDYFVPVSAAIGYHFYDVKVQFLQTDGGNTEQSGVYEHSAGNLVVGTSEHRECDRLYVQLNTELNRLNTAGEDQFRSSGNYPTYLINANEEFYTAKTLYNNEDFTAALPHLQGVKALLGEQTSEAATGQFQSSQLVWLTIIPVAVAILASFLILRLRKGSR